MIVTDPILRALAYTGGTHLEKEMSKRGKNAIRLQPCALCLAVPPFGDGSKCHPHRLIPGRDGGRYVASNVIPLCPPCHANSAGS